MFDAAIWIEYNETCRAIATESKCTDDEIWFSFPILTFSLLALVLNVICILIFLRQKRRSLMRLSLLLLSTSEVLFHTFICLDYSNRLFVCSQNSHTLSPLRRILIACINLGADTLLCSRNWCNVLITAARTEVVISPIRSRRIFTRRSIIAMYFSVLTIAVMLSLVRSFYDYILLCLTESNSDTEGGVRRNVLLHGAHMVLPLLSDSFVSSYEAYCFFIFQVIVPVMLVLAMSSTIACYMSPCKQSEILEVSMVRRRHQMNATRTILLLAATFLCFEMPSFILVLLQHYTRLVSSEESRFRYKVAQFAADMLLTSDSIANIMIYSFKLPEFRRHLTRCCCCSCCCFARSVSEQSEMDNEFSRTNLSVFRRTDSSVKFSQQPSIARSPQPVLSGRNCPSAKARLVLMHSAPEKPQDEMERF
ncbi:Rhodopsin orphan GPCR [Fasciola hepatica]|uniref:Rhodopsin orphan GPCR n=1 Tax=Fasciola hepatica TaxID=6192 RepID=A0A4E0RSL9_FASHE|nr:Rhodopsin orphan GPCR [Fasciola hepatica]